VPDEEEGRFVMLFYAFGIAGIIGAMAEGVASDGGDMRCILRRGV
jgi:hypothetical protein